MGHIIRNILMYILYRSNIFCECCCAR